MGNSEILVWPDQVAMMSLYTLSRPRNKSLSSDADSLSLLWPSKLINELARLRQRRDFSRPVAIFSFIISLILAIAIGPAQLFLIASTGDYNWVTTVYFPEALRYTLLVSGIVAIIDFGALILAWRSRPKRTRTTIALVTSSLIIIGLIWLASQIIGWQPHHITITLLGALIFCLIILLLLSKQYITEQYNNLLTKITLVLLMISALFSAIGGFRYYQASSEVDPVKISQISANQAAARIEGVSELLSNAVFTLCNGKYQIVFLSELHAAGLFECTKTGDIYSANELTSTSGRTISTATTYLGTISDPTISRAFPNSYYLYRSLPQALSEDELVLMLPASSEQELIDNFAPLLLAYWQTNNQRNLFINVFYNKNLDEISSTKDYILMAALETMARTDKLPHGNTIVGYHQGQKVNYRYFEDEDQYALNELGADPTLYANSTRYALTTQRHISLHLQAGQELDPATLRTTLQESLTGGM